jgi:hypothetical protein
MIHDSMGVACDRWGYPFCYTDFRDSYKGGSIYANRDEPRWRVGFIDYLKRRSRTRPTTARALIPQRDSLRVIHHQHFHCAFFLFELQSELGLKGGEESGGDGW